MFNIYENCLLKQTEFTGFQAGSHFETLCWQVADIPFNGEIRSEII